MTGVRRSAHAGIEEGAPNPRGRESGRPRDAALDEAVLDAAADLLRETTVTACTIEAVSRRSGVGKPAIYRRWPNRTVLAVDAFARRLSVDVPLIDTGDAVTDLTNNFVSLAEHYRGPDGHIIAQLLAAAVLEPGAAALLEDRLFADRRRALEALWQRGVQRGQLRRDIEPDDALDLVFGAGILRLLLRPDSLNAAGAARLAAAALRGLADPTRPVPSR